MVLMSSATHSTSLLGEIKKMQYNLCKATLKKTKKLFSRPIISNAGQKYCRMLQGEHSTILSTFIKLPFAIKIFILSIFDWPFYTGFTVHS